MSSSFTDQPSPHDPRHEQGYTPTPPPPQRGRDADEDENDVGRPRPKLGSLAQKARGKKLRQARGILFFIGGLTLIFQVIFLFVDLNENVEPLLAIAFHGLFILVGALFIVFGALIYRFPVPITITSLVVYILVTLIDVALAALTDPARMTAGIIWKFIFIAALISSIQSAVAYERERRAEEEYALEE
jgi:hypothetical protein